MDNVDNVDRVINVNNVDRVKNDGNSNDLTAIYKSYSMNKKRLFKIMANAEAGVLKKISDNLSSRYETIIIKEPSKTLTMVKMREPVKETLFYIGEVIVCDSIVDLKGTKGFAVTMGDDFDKVLSMAIIDAAFNKNVKELDGICNTLFNLEKEQQLAIEKENSLYLKTMVNFKSMDTLSPSNKSSPSNSNFASKDIKKSTDNEVL